ncbi:hypothetical protein BHE74_00027747 [Ensete ventricosum]|nr:hypothetical protein GW17_00048755 [Ensete ventricosum]RWW64967.1 hypothetical protein BHE74_00027747 [Ensete ventricosum]RZS11422.1 hypothetical protein BHM03_00042750 [Ensete ventricosum]
MTTAAAAAKGRSKGAEEVKQRKGFHPSRSPSSFARVTTVPSCFSLFLLTSRERF